MWSPPPRAIPAFSLRRAACGVRRVLRGFFYHTPHATRCLSSLLSPLFSWLLGLRLAARAQSLLVIDYWSSRADPHHYTATGGIWWQSTGGITQIFGGINRVLPPACPPARGRPNPRAAPRHRQRPPRAAPRSSIRRPLALFRCRRSTDRKPVN
jgi:hypothetical protein